MELNMTAIFLTAALAGSSCFTTPAMTHQDTRVHSMLGTWARGQHPKPLILCIAPQGNMFVQVVAKDYLDTRPLTSFWHFIGWHKSLGVQTMTISVAFMQEPVKAIETISEIDRVLKIGGFLILDLQRRGFWKRWLIDHGYEKLPFLWNYYEIYHKQLNAST